MSLLAVIPKTAGIRPPIWPPAETTFDPTPGPDGEPMHRRIADSVTFLIKTIDRTPDEHLGTILDLLAQRKRWIESELSTLRMLEPAVLPPLIAGFPADPFAAQEDELSPFYLRLLAKIDDAMKTVRARLWVQKQDVFTSER